MSKSKKKYHPKSRYRGVRPFWSGTLTFGLVSVPVHLYPAQRSPRVRMRLLAPDGVPLTRKYFCAEHEVDVHPEHLVRGYELENGEYVVVRDDELEQAAPKKSREIDLRQFVDLDQVPPRLFERAYFLTPAGDSNKAYRLLAKVMESSDLAGVATFVMRGKEYFVAILAEHGILRAQTLRFPDEVRSPGDVGLPERQKPEAKQVRAFKSAIKALLQDSLSGVNLDDPSLKQIEKLVARRRKSKDHVVKLEAGEAEASPDENDDSGDATSGHVDLLETIRQSLSQSTGRSAGNGKAVSNGKASERLGELSKDELYERAQQLDIEGRSRMSKRQLIDAVKSSF